MQAALCQRLAASTVLVWKIRAERTELRLQMRAFWKITNRVAIVTAIVAVVIALESYVLYRDNLLMDLSSELGRWLTWLCFLPVILMLVRRFPALNFAGFLIHLGAALSMAVAHYILIQHLPGNFRFSYDGPVAAALSWEIINYGQLALICYAITFAIRENEQHMQMLELNRLVSEARLQALQTEMQPEELLHHLRRIQALVRKSADQADRAIVSFGDDLRKHLHSQTGTADLYIDAPLQQLMKKLAELQPEKARRPRSFWIVAIWSSAISYFLLRNVIMSLYAPVDWLRAGWITVAWCTWAFLTPAVLRLEDKFSFERPPYLHKIAIHLAGMFFCWLIVLTVFVAGPWLSGQTTGSFIDSFEHHLHTYGFMTDVLTYATILLIASVSRKYRRMQNAAARILEMQSSLLDSQLMALQMQIHPHFLFNALHSISELVHEAPEVALVMLRKLESLFERTLKQPASHLVELDVELEFLKCYLEIEKVRFEDHLQVDLQIEQSSRNLLVPNLILQPIVENAIRHGAPPNNGTRSVTIASSVNGNVLQLQVEDNGPGLLREKSVPRGLGLQNVRTRLRQLYGNADLLTLAGGSHGGLLVNIDIPIQ